MKTNDQHILGSSTEDDSDMMICPFLASGFIAKYGDVIPYAFNDSVKCMCSRCMLWDSIKSWCSLKIRLNVVKK